MAYRRLSLVAMLFFLLPLASAYTIEDFWIEWQGNRVETLSPIKSLPGSVLKFTLSSDFAGCFGSTDVCALRLDSDQISILSSKRIDVRERCVQNDVITCTTEVFTFSTQQETLEITYIVSALGDSPRDQMTVSTSIVLDETSPQVSSITTGYCEEDVCYVAANVPTDVTIEMTDTVTSFDWKLVFFGTTGSFQRVEDCQGSTCTGMISVVCSHGQTLTLGIKPAQGVTPREDAQNDVIPGTGQQIFCAGQPPEIRSWKEEADGIAGLAVSGGTLTLTAEVATDVGDPSGKVNVSGILGNTSEELEALCQETEEGKQECVWQLSGLEPGTFDLEFYVYDAIGNYRTRDARITVLHLETPGENQSLNFFSSTVKDVTPESLNRMALELAAANYLPYPLYVHYELQRTNPRARVMRQELSECWYKTSNDTNWTKEHNLVALGSGTGGRAESHVLYENADWDQQNRLDIQVRSDSDTLALADEFQTRCSVDLTIVTDDTLYTEPERELVEFSIKLRESPLGRPGARVVDKIQEVEDEIVNGKWKLIRKLEEWRQKADQICQGFDTLVQIRTVYSGISVLASGMCSTGVGAVAGEPLQVSNAGADKGLGSILNQLWYGDHFSDVPGGRPGVTADFAKTLVDLALPSNIGGQGGIVRKICRQVNCKLAGEWDGQTGAEQSFGEYVTSSVLENAAVADPEASLTGAVWNLCIGGVIFNLQKYGAVECGYLQCLKEQSSGGYSMSVCELGRSYQICTQVVGEIGELPVIRVFKNIANNINGIIQNLPTFVWKWVHRNRCAEYVGLAGFPLKANCFDGYMVTCMIESALLGVVDQQTQSTQALDGIDPGKAERALEICNQAVESEIGRPSGMLLSAGTRLTGVQRDQLARANNPASKRLLNDLDNAYKSVTGAKPESTADAIKAYENAFSALGNYRVGYSGTWSGEKDSALVLFRYRPPKGRVFFVDSRGELIITYTEDDRQRTLRIPVPADALGENNELLELYEDPQFIEAVQSGMTFTSVNQYREYRSRLATVHLAHINSLTARREALEKKLSEETNPKAKETIRKQLNELEEAYSLASINGRIAELDNKICIGQTCPAGSFTADDVQERDKLIAQRDAIENQRQHVQDRLVDIDTRLGELNCGEGKCGFAQRKEAKRLEEEKNNLRGVLGDDLGEDEEKITQRDLERSRAAQQFGMAIREVASFAFKNLIDEEKLKYFQTRSWADDIGLGGVLDFAEDYLDFEGFKQNLCNDLVYDLEDNEEGAIYEPSEFGTPNVVASFGAEVRTILNSSNNETESYMYVMIALVHSPPESEYTLEIVLKDPEECLQQPCDDEYSLTNGVSFNLSQEGFSNAGVAKTRLEYLQTKYGQMCLRFNDKFPTRSGKREYCRAVKEKTFSTGSPLPPATVASDPDSPTGTTTTSDPTEGWS